MNKLRNVEIKAKVKDLTLLLKKAQEISGSEGTLIKQHDTFYNGNQGRLKLRRYEDGAAELISYDRPDKEGPKLSDYDKCLITPEGVEGLNRVLIRALGSPGEVKKIRRLFMVEQTRIHVDSVEGLGDFMELEVGLKPEETLERGQEIALDLMEKLGVEKDDLIAGAYMDLLTKL